MPRAVLSGASASLLSLTLRLFHDTTLFGRALRRLPVPCLDLMLRPP